MLCGYCSKLATTQIPATPGDVCSTHAIEFWKGLLAFAHECRDAGVTPPPIVGRPAVNQRVQPRTAEPGWSGMRRQAVAVSRH